MFFICKICSNYANLRCLLDIKVLTQQVKGAGTLSAHCSVDSSGFLAITNYKWIDIPFMAVAGMSPKKEK